MVLPNVRVRHTGSPSTVEPIGTTTQKDKGSLPMYGVFDKSQRCDSCIEHEAFGILRRIYEDDQSPDHTTAGDSCTSGISTTLEPVSELRFGTTQKEDARNTTKVVNFLTARLLSPHIAMAFLKATVTAGPSP